MSSANGLGTPPTPPHPVEPARQASRRVASGHRTAPSFATRPATAPQAQGPGTIRRTGFALAGALALAGCSVHPLYGVRDIGGGGELAATLQSIHIEPIPDRLGHYVENELSFDLNGTGATVSPRYRLFITLHESAQTPVIDTVSGRASAATVVINADYRLMQAAQETPVTQGHVFVAASYDRTSQRFSNIRAARDAEQRDAKTLADQIYTKLAATLAPKG